MTLIAYTIIEGDRLPDVAQRLTGDAANWQAIAAFNDLRAPYVSADPTARLGPPLLTAALAARVVPGAAAITLASPPPASLIDVGGLLLLSLPDPTGGTLVDTLPIARYDASTGIVTTTGVASRAYPAGGPVAVYAAERDGRVLRPGDALYIPTGAAAPLRATDRVIDPFGTDLALDKEGFLVWGETAHASGYATLTLAAVRTTDIALPSGIAFLDQTTGRIARLAALVTLPRGSAPVAVDLPLRAAAIGAGGDIPQGTVLTLIPTSLDAALAPLLAGSTCVTASPLVAPYRSGDFRTVSGAANAAQAIAGRIATGKGELPWHPTFGNAAWSLLGEPLSPTTRSLATMDTAAAVKQDFRVASVTAITPHERPDGVAFDVRVTLRGSGAQLRVDAALKAIA